MLRKSDQTPQKPMCAWDCFWQTGFTSGKNLLRLIHEIVKSDRIGTLALVNPIDGAAGAIEGLAGTEPGIKITVEHVLETHGIEGAATAGKSIFAAEVDISGLIEAAGAVAPSQAANGNLVRIVDAGRKRTSLVRSSHRFLCTQWSQTRRVV
jgi:hypothetical protein